MNDEAGISLVWLGWLSALDVSCRFDKDEQPGEGEILMTGYVYLAVAIVAEVVATSALKATEGFSRLIPSIVVVSGYGLAFYMLSLTLRTIPVGVAYALWCGVGMALISVIGWTVLKQRLDAGAIIGIALIVIGVIVLSVFSRAAVR